MFITAICVIFLMSSISLIQSSRNNNKQMRYDWFIS